MNWTERILGRTRVTLLAMMRRSKRSINELAGVLGITDNAVRTHVAAMERDGMIRAAGVERATGGKPAQLYELTPEAEEMFPKAYAAILNGVLSLLEEREGRERVTELLREVGVRAAGPRAPADRPLEQRVEDAANALRSLGGDVEVERTEEGWKIRGFGCPLSAVVREHSEACELTESLVSEIVGRPAAECCDRGERPRCRFDISEP